MRGTTDTRNHDPLQNRRRPGHGRRLRLLTPAASAKDSAPIDIFGISSCEAGVWAIDLRLNSTLLQDLMVDVYDTIDAPDFAVDSAAGGLAPAETAGGQRKALVASSIPLTFQNPVIVRFHPAPDKKSDTVVVVPAGASFDDRLVDTKVDSTCPYRRFVNPQFG